MIGRLTGILIEKQPPHLLLEVNGVAYELQVPMSTFYDLPELGQKVILHTHLVVREDAHLLYGFYSLQERRLFRALIKVNGVGPKLAITILSGIEPHDFVRCIQDNDTVALSRLPGIGKKTAERLIVEMRDRLTDWLDTELTVTGVNPITLASGSIPVSTVNDAISALVALGYKAAEASKAVQKIKDHHSLSSEQLIRQALQQV